MNAPLPDVPPPTPTKAKSDAPEGLRWIVALQFVTFLMAFALAMWFFFTEPQEEELEPLAIWLLMSVITTLAALYLVPFFFLLRGAQWARRLVIGLVVFFWVYDQFLSGAPEKQRPLFDEVFGWICSLLSIWTLIYLFLPNVRAYFGSK